MCEKIFVCTECDSMGWHITSIDHCIGCDGVWNTDFIREAYLTKFMPTEPKHGLTDEDILKLQQKFSMYTKGAFIIERFLKENKLRLDHPED